MTLLLVGSLVGLWLGYHVGIRRAERGIAKAGMSGTWARRSAWREK